LAHENDTFWRTQNGIPKFFQPLSHKDLRIPDKKVGPRICAQK
jgi:hypothetical protein